MDSMVFILISFVSGMGVAIMNIDSIRRKISEGIGTYLFKNSSFYNGFLRIGVIEKEINDVKKTVLKHLIMDMIRNDRNLEDVLEEYDEYEKSGGNSYIKSKVEEYKIKKCKDD